MRIRSILAAAIGTAGVAWGAAPANPTAFPGAEGFGAEASGGRGGEVYHVTNLNDSGPGSLRDAVSKPNRTVVFDVSGTITLNSRLEISKPNITIAGQTAPGDGIALRKHELMIKNTENIIVRFLRIRPGDEAKAEMDAVTVWGSKDVILDHCSMSWSTDSLNDVVKESGNVTVQWCLLAEPLVHSVHKKGAHGYATGWDGRTRGGMTAHHNLIAHAASRAPRIGYFKTGRGLIDCVNNVIYNSGPSYGGETDDLNFVANYYRPGPNSYQALEENKPVRKKGELFDVWSDDTRMYVAGNVVEGSPEVKSNNAAAIAFKKTSNTQPVNGLPPPKPGTREDCIVAKPFDVAPVKIDAAEVALKRVVENVGAVLPKRDAADTRITNDVKNRTGRFIDTPGDVGGWPELKSTAAPLDTDQDGMPDAWEEANGLDANNAADGKAITSDGYSNLEHYLNDLAAKAF